MSNIFEIKDEELFFDGVELSTVAKKFGTPCYIYSKNLIEKNFNGYREHLSSENNFICYAVKANPNVAILQILAKLGSGFDVTSQGELNRVLYAGGDPKKIIFSGVGKSESDIKKGLDAKIKCFNVESKYELLLINRTAKTNDIKASISIRVNPNVDANTHPYIATGLKNDKFGVDMREAHGIFKLASELSNIEIMGIACHIGSQIYDIAPFRESLQILMHFVDKLKLDNIHLSHIDIGGGLGTLKEDTNQTNIKEFSKTIMNDCSGRTEKIIIEPGRSIVGNAGVLLMKTEYVKTNGEKNFAIVDAGMNDYIRPALYQAEMEIKSVSPNSAQSKIYDIVGPVCESGDFLGKDRELPIETGDLLCLCDAGAYGFTMSSNYNSRCRPTEILIVDESLHVIRERETFEDLIKNEKLIEYIN